MDRPKRPNIKNFEAGVTIFRGLTNYSNAQDEFIDAIETSLTAVRSEVEQEKRKVTILADEGVNLSKELQKLKEDSESLKIQLRVQITGNKELKKKNQDLEIEIQTLVIQSFPINKTN